jgi:hypothetical protein
VVAAWGEGRATGGVCSWKGWCCPMSDPATPTQDVVVQSESE